MKYCSHCGKELAEEAVICPNCGCAVDGVTAKKSSESNSDIIAILGLVFSFISSIVGLVLSIIAYKSAVAEDNKRNKNFAVAGIAVSSVSIAASVITVILVFAFWGVTLASMPIS